MHFAAPYGLFNCPICFIKPLRFRARVSREKKSMKLHLNPLERSRKQCSEDKKFSFRITFKFSFATRFVKTTIYINKAS